MFQLLKVAALAHAACAFVWTPPRLPLGGLAAATTPWECDDAGCYVLFGADEARPATRVEIDAARTRDAAKVTATLEDHGFRAGAFTSGECSVVGDGPNVVCHGNVDTFAGLAF